MKEQDDNPYSPPKDYGLWIPQTDSSGKARLALWCLFVSYSSVASQYLAIACYFLFPLRGASMAAALAIYWLSVPFGLFSVVVCLLYGNFAVRLLAIFPAIYHIYRAYQLACSVV